jgi:hypothetical protein
MRLAVHQPNYIPWCGYFAKMRACDVFVFLDNVQMPSGRSYVSRSLVRSPQGAGWLSVPTHHHSRECILTVKFADPTWNERHLKTLHTIYKACPYFDEVFAMIEPIYSEPGDALVGFNMRMVEVIASYLGLACRIEVSSLIGPEGQGDDRLISLARLTGADIYMSGKGGQSYQNPAKFVARGIRLEEHEYVAVSYPQVQGGFVPNLSILDALFHLGKNAVSLLEYPVVASYDPTIC